MQTGPAERAVWDRAQVLALGRDTASRQAALGLPADAWDGLGRDGVRLWGLCQGSRTAPYEVVVDLEAPHYVCSCPSSKVPCKHALSLLLQWSEGNVPPGEPPAFAVERLGARASAAEAKAQRPAGELADPAAAAA